MHPYQKELSALAQSLQLVIDEANQLPPEMSAIQIRVSNKLRLEQNFINGLLGTAMVTHNQADSPAITHVMGVPVDIRQPVTVEQITPTNMERDKFLKDRDNLYDRFLELTNEKIYASIRQPGYDAIFRAVAKKAGVEDYAEAKVNDKFISVVRKAIQDAKSLEKTLEDAKNKING